MEKILKKIQDYLKKLAAVKLNESSVVKLFIFAITTLLISFMLPSYKSIDAEYEVGSIWSKEDLIAAFSFPVYRDEADYEKEKSEVASNTEIVFDERKINKSAIADSIGIELSLLSEIAKDSVSIQKYISAPEKVNSKNQYTLNEIFSINQKLKDKNWSRITGNFTDNILDLQDEWIINIPKSEIKSKKVSIKKENDKLQYSEDLNKVSDKNEAADNSIAGLSISEIDTSLSAAFKKIALSFIKPDLIYNKEYTDLIINSRIEQVPKTLDIVKENERIVSKHDPINKATKLKLDSYKKVRLEKIGVEDIFIQYAGKILTVITLLVILSLFLYSLRKKIFEDNSKLILIASLVLLACFFSFISLKLNVNAPVEILIFAASASILITIIFDSRVSFYTTTINCFLIGAIRGGDYSIAFITFCGCILSIFSVRDVKHRSQIFRSFFFILAGYTISILAIGFDKIEDQQMILNQLLFGAVNAIMSPIIAFGLLFFYERVFKVTTDLTLLELSDFNHPLLKELSSKAPGTFHHSIVMGNLSEAAAKAINANSILARVGCYYHDIGKTVRPQYFIENQMEHNSHDSLTPTISTKLIIAHVKEGVELARKYNLPEEIIDFIPMHHGTTLVAYFYNKAKFARNGKGDSEVADYLYRYPGPKPQTKETGIVMLADSIEASTRAIEDPTPKKLETRIDEVIKNRFIEGELDECELTFRDLTRIKQSFQKVLLGIHHHRIKYPDEKAQALRKKVF
ncbi:HDIG domain-containing protein [soil metagenome]